MKIKSFNKNLKTFGKFLLILITGVTLSQCSSSNLTSGGSSTYNLTLGDVEESGFQQLVNRVRNIHHYEIERDEQYRSSEAYIITYWKKSQPFSNNPNYKAEEVETRITLRSKLKNRQGYKMYTVRFIGEYRALLPTESGGSEFQNVKLTPEAEDYFQDIAYDLRDRVRGSIRGY